MRNHKKKDRQRNPEISRRDFICMAAYTAAFTIVPRQVLGGPGHIPPSEKLNIAGIGVGSRGSGLLRTRKEMNSGFMTYWDR